MCGRFAFYSPGEATAALFGVSGALAIEARYNIAPTQYIAAIRNDGEDGRELTMLRWGLVPFWAKDPSIGNRMINARAETVAEKPSYRAAYRHRRCLVLADGFYEWHTEDGVKTPYYISAADGEPFAFAALWEKDEFMSNLHHRMPVILRSETADRWLAGDDDLIDFAVSHGPQLRAWAVDRRVNNARNEGEDLIEAVS
jgi:putative SOS response-associated peptidase YedK